jgi:Peptidyl-prolyl cis-trans isomerase (rotamase) - cyclophilin family
MELSIGDSNPVRLLLDLHSQSCPRTVLNFTTLLTRTAPNGYIQSKFHRLIPTFMIQGGDFTNGDGTGGHSIYDGDVFGDENFDHSHDARGVLSMANSGKNTNGSQFFITFRQTRHLDGKHVVFGRVDMTDDDSKKLLDRLEMIRVGSGDVPLVDITVTGGGVIRKLKEREEEEKIQEVEENAMVPQDEDEIDLDEAIDDDDDDVGDKKKENCRKDQGEGIGPDLSSMEQGQNVNDHNGADSKKAQLQERLRKLKMKINQSRQLNKKEVLSEGERLGSKEAHARYMKQVKKEEKTRKEQETMQIHGKAYIGSEYDKKEAKAMMQSGNESIYQVMKRETTDEKNMFSPKDYYNPEGQFRNYENSVKSIRPGNLIPLRSNPDDIHSEHGKQREREGAMRLASELKRRAQKAEKRKQKSVEFEGEDVSYINKRNKRFNEKIGRNYDKHTAEIRQNLERGTAL